MVILDSNIYIYLANGTVPADVIVGEEIAFASITRIESLGYLNLSVIEAQQLVKFFGSAYQYDLTEAVINRAIVLRQGKRIKLGDAIIAATALEHDCQLWTANTEDFAAIDDLKLRNPLLKS